MVIKNSLATYITYNVWQYTDCLAASTELK